MSARRQLARILVPLDGSRLAEAILPVVAPLARDHEAEVILLEVMEGQGRLETELERVRQAGADLERAAAYLRSRGVARASVRIWYGEADQAIANAATREQASIIAMSTHGRSGLDRLRFGSVAERVVRRAPVPVLLVRGNPVWDEGGIARILMPLDRSEASEAVIPIVACLAGPFDLEIHLLHVVERAWTEPEPGAGGKGAADAEAEAYLRGVAARLEARGLCVRVTARAGTPADVIPAVAAETKCGLVAMSTHGRSGLERLLMGSVAERVLRAVTVPVLMWKPPAGDRETRAARRGARDRRAPARHGPEMRRSPPEEPR
jgi:nucleotide-binding universal stress UspA family protein